MGSNYYRFVGSVDPASRIDDIVVESGTVDSPEKKLYLNGVPEELNEDQHAKLSRYVQLEQVSVKELKTLDIADEPASGSVKKGV